MTLLAIPNVSEGRRADVIARLVDAVSSAGCAVLDLHRDPVHNRSVLTITAAPEVLIEGCVRLAAATGEIDLRHHSGVHPRLGALDVCPFVPHARTPMDDALAAAREAGRRMGGELSLPVFLYANAARRPETRDLPLLRRGGLDGLMRRIANGLEPDAGPRRMDPARGVVCVGARGPLIAFNVWLDSDLPTAKQIALTVRSPAVRALGLQMSAGVTQVSMNLIDPERADIEAAFASVESAAGAAGAAVRATEIVGLVEERFLPPPDTTAARLLVEPGQTVEGALELVR